MGFGTFVAPVRRTFRLYVESGTQLSKPLVNEFRSNLRETLISSNAALGRIASDPNALKLGAAYTAVAQSRTGIAVTRFMASPVGKAIYYVIPK